MQNTARFSSELFNSTIPQDNGAGFGEDVGRWLKTRLEEKGYSVGGPDREEGGWRIEAKKDGARSNIDVSLVEDEDGVQWQLSAQVSIPLMKKLFGVPEKEVSPALLKDLEQILENEPDIRQITWLNLDEQGGESETEVLRA